MSNLHGQRFCLSSLLERLFPTDEGNKYGMEKFLSVAPDAPVSDGPFTHGFYMDGNWLRYRHTFWDVYKPTSLCLEVMYLLLFTWVGVPTYIITFAFFQHFLHPEVAKGACFFILVLVYPIYRFGYLIPILNIHVWKPSTCYELAARIIFRENTFSLPHSVKFEEVKYLVILKNGKSFHVPWQSSYGFFPYLPCDIQIACVDRNNEMCALASFYNQEARAAEFVDAISRLLGREIPVREPSEKEHKFARQNNIKRGVR